MQQFKTIRTFGKNICAGKITLNNADKDQSNLLLEIIDFNKNTKPRNSSNKKTKKRYSWKPDSLMKVEKQFLKACNTSENLLTKIIQNIYSLYWAKETTKMYITI